MAVLPILTWPDPCLSQVAVAVGNRDVRGLAADLLDTMYAAPGRGLAAPQVGVLERVFVMDVTWKEGPPSPVVCIDPEILWQADDTSEAEEGCLSIPGVLVSVERPVAVRLRWRDADGVAQEAMFEGMEALCIQHELDHLDGRVTFDRVTPEARAAAETAYAAERA